MITTNRYMSGFPQQVKLQEDKLHIFLVTVLIFLIYCWSAPRTIVLEDDSFFILVAYYNGIAHPPGYPLYTLLAHLATYIPLGSIAYRVHLLSALFGAVSCGCLWWFSRLIFPGKLFAYAAGLLYGLSNILWSQSIIAEVYTLNVLLFLILLILSINYVSNQNRLYLLSIAFVYGLALSNHWPLILLSTPMMLCILWPVRKHIISNLIIAIPVLLLGLLPYLWMYFRSQMDPFISFNGPIYDIHELILTVSRDVYSEAESSLSAGWYDKLLFSGFALRETAEQFGFLCIIFAVIGFLYQWKYWPRIFCFALIAGYLGNTFLLIGLLGFDYDDLHRVIFRVYPLIAYLCVVLWLALGIHVASVALKKLKYITVNQLQIQVVICIFAVALTFAENLPKNFRAKDNWAERYARVILESLDENAIIFTKGDITTGQLGYMHYIDGIRQDISLYNEIGLAYSNRLFRPHTIQKSEADSLIKNFIDNTDRPIYYISDEFQDSYGIIDFGLYLKLDKELLKNERMAIADQLITRYLLTIVQDGEPVDPWESIHYRLMVTSICRVIANLYELGEQTSQMSNWLTNNCNHYHALLQYVFLLLNLESQDFKKMNELLDAAMTMRDQSITKADTSTPEFYRGEILLRQGKVDEALQYFHRSIKLWPHTQNPAFIKLKSLLDDDQNTS